MVAYGFKERFIAPIEVGLGRDITGPSAVAFPAPKLQTIRAHGRRRHARPGEILQLYYAMRTKQCRLIGVAKCVEVLPVIIWPSTGTIMLAGKLLGLRKLNWFAQSDGFVSIFDMMAFWQEEHPGDKFDGVCVRWEPINGEP